MADNLKAEKIAAAKKKVLNEQIVILILMGK